MSFGKGSRSCEGIELGKAEFLTALASVWYRFGNDMQLLDTIRERDVDVEYDLFNPVTKKDGNGVMVTLRK